MHHLDVESTSLDTALTVRDQNDVNRVFNHHSFAIKDRLNLNLQNESSPIKKTEPRDILDSVFFASLHQQHIVETYRIMRVIRLCWCYIIVWSQNRCRTVHDKAIRMTVWHTIKEVQLTRIDQPSNFVRIGQQPGGISSSQV